MKKVTTYQDAGVDIAKGESLVEKIKEKVRGTYGPQVVHGVGGFCSLYDMGDGRLLAAGTDGVGTKIKLAINLGIHHTIGIDLVAMCVNDVLCCGARPLFFLDYLATGKLDLEVSERLIEGIVQGCKESKMPLMGGETAEMPGLYAPGDYDLAGFCVGEVHRDQLIDGQRLQEGDLILGLSSSGFHSNGYSLIRQLVGEEEHALLKECLTPTRIYVRPILELLKRFPGSVKGMAHITGGGVRNILRINPEWGYSFHSWPTQQEWPSAIAQVVQRSHLSPQEIYRTFNMGIGMVLVVDKNKAQDLCLLLRELGENVRVLGQVIPSAGQLILKVEGKEIQL